MDSEIQKQDGAQEAGRSSLHEVLGRIRALKAKAAAKQAAIDACDGHLWKTDYVSQITASGGSCVCVRCGERRAWKDIGANEPNVLSAP